MTPADRAPGQSALTVLLAARGDADEVVALLADYAAVGLVAPFVWVYASNVDGSSVPATLVRDGRSSAVVLQQFLTAERFDRLRLAVLVPADAPADQRVPCAAEQTLEQMVRGCAVGAPVTLLRLLFCRGAPARHSNGRYAPELVLEGWHNLLVAPEDSAGPGLGSVALDRLADPVDVARHVAPVVASVAGLWTGIKRVPFDDIAILPGQTLRAVRAFYRQLDATGVEDQLRRQLFDAAGRLPLPRSAQGPVVYVQDVALANQTVARSVWRKHRDVLRGGRIEIGGHEQQAISPWAACKIFFSFLWAALRNAPSVWLGGMLSSVSSVLATTVQHAVFGRSDSAYAVVAGGAVTSWQDIERGAEQLSTLLGEHSEARHMVQTDLTPLWVDYVNGALTLADGGRRSAGIEPVRVGIGIGVVHDSGDVVPSAADAFAAIHPSLAAVIGARGVQGGDILGAADVKNRLERTFGDAAAGLEARHAFARLTEWEEAHAKSYATQCASILTEFLGRARGEVADLVQRIRQAAEDDGVEQRLRRRERVIATITRTAGWAVFFALIALLVVAGFGWVGWDFSLVVGAVLVGVYVLAALLLFVLGQRHLFAELNRRQNQMTDLEAMHFNLRAALQDVSRLSSAYGQLMAWNRVLGEVLRAPFGPIAPARPTDAQVVDGLPRSVQIGVAATADGAAESAANSLQQRLYSVGWLSRPWEQMLDSMGRQSGDDAATLFRMPGAGSGSVLDEWSAEVASGAVRPPGADALWKQVQGIFDDPASGVADTLTDGVVVPATGERIPLARFSGVLEKRSAPAPFDARLFTDAAATAGRSMVAVDDTVVDRHGLSYQAVVTQAGDGLPTYDFSMFSPELAAASCEEEPPPESGSLVF
ncbi:hypothetical protein HMPREF0591_2468 [Mycobacterium parascrofulaceum ATCC BAA-614]|uniref:Uncharacterized protein n=1 Tax=Mycobacterium parascrofulaceum ATCC BAA-614 TaxID=525368 RepID=D5P8F3_9MYCO|nr:hypothetical protein [Mycobacterium parascrofulaceum]EFG77659.1 hypothetical protein HMPREF0591_2468 [Mycobacterium parascrofulaceum ATCC BAA-614]